MRALMPAPRKLTVNESKGLSKLFGRRPEGARAVLDRMGKGEKISLPEGVSQETLLQYRRVAQDAINAGKDKLGTQELRIQIIDNLMGL